MTNLYAIDFKYETLNKWLTFNKQKTFYSKALFKILNIFKQMNLKPKVSFFYRVFIAFCKGLQIAQYIK